MKAMLAAQSGYKFDGVSYPHGDDQVGTRTFQKVATIKAVRQLSGLGLKEAKGIIDDLVASGYGHRVEIPLSPDLQLDGKQTAISVLALNGIELTENAALLNAIKAAASIALDTNEPYILGQLVDILKELS